MADQQQNTSNTSTNITSKAALVTDLNSSYIGNDMYSYARNNVRSSKEGDLGTVGNEPSNLFCVEAPYKIIGHVELPNDEVMLFSTNNTVSEIGISNLTRCTYNKLLSLPCLNFNDEFLIKGVSKVDFQRGTVVTFTDKHNPVRRLELKNASDILDCDDILLFKKIEHPCITVSKGQVGNMPNGVYSVAISYVVNNEIFSDWYSITNRIALNSETGNNSLEVKITGLDTEFDQFAVVVVGNYEEPETGSVTKLAKIIGNFSTKVSSLSVTDFLNPNYTDVKLSELVIHKKSWLKAGIITANTNYLLLGDLVSREEENYQLKAMSIKSEYVVEQIPVDYYEDDGIDVGYYRDENYDFYIQGIYNSGELTEKFHIPGRLSKSTDLAPVSSPDVYEFDKQFSDCDIRTKIPRWQVENTASKMIPHNDEFKCDRRVLGKGDMGYFQSTDLYPDNPAMFGEWANTPQRFHKMPDECKVPRYSVIDGKTYINILGVRFYDIPKFDNPDIVGYKFTRSDRKGGNGTVVARGLMTNIRSYFDPFLNRTVMYNNYTVNDLSSDQYLSSTQTVFKNNKENNFNPLTDYYKDRFAFYSPHTSFEPRYTLGSELKIESEEIADVTGKFDLVFNHPKQKLMNQFAFWLSAAVGFIETTLILIGKNTHKAETEFQIKTTAVDGGTITIHKAGQDYNITSVEGLVGLDIVSFIKDKILAKDLSAFTIVKNVLAAIASLAIKIPYSILGGIKAAEDIFETIYNFTGFTDYVYQYNANAFFNRSVCAKEGNKRRRLLSTAKYIPSSQVSIDNNILNNKNRERFVYLQLNKEISDPTTKDNTRQTASGFGICDNLTQQTISTGSAFYVTSKVPNPNQYGQLGSAPPVSMHSCPISTEDISPILYGGDCIITRFNFLKKMQFFTQNIANTNYPNGTEYDYKKYGNIAFPRFWIDSTKYDFSEILSSNVINFARFSRTTTSKHNLDCKSGDKKNIARIDDAYMYLSNNAGVDFIVECDYHAQFRKKTEFPFFSKDNNNLQEIFRSDRLDRDEEFDISLAYRDIYTTEISATQQRDDFDPLDPIPVEQPNSVIYSLPSFNLQEVDNWQYFLPLNFFAFRESDYGKLTSIHRLDQDRMIFLFSKSSPYISMGRDFLELEQSGRKITIGDGGLFAQDPREIMPTDNNYGASTSRYAFSNTHLGRFYPSSTQGRILSFTESLEDITRQGMSYWCKNYMPIFLYNHFPNYDKEENPVTGVGYLSIFDSFNETIYVTKRDFVPKREYASDISYTNGQFFYRGVRILLRSQYFSDVSWTLSYCPIDKAFASWHDWHPDWVIQRDNHFVTIKDRGIWKHNERFDSFCNFYGVDYPYMLEILSSSGQQIETVRSLEYILEVYKYKNFGRDRFHVHHENFDTLLVSNSEQISPILNLSYRSSNPEMDLQFPKKNNDFSWNILYSKEENKYRTNMFWDSVKNRGEFGGDEFHLISTDESGYKQVINTAAIDIDKPEDQRKKFRHYFNKFRLMKTVSGSNKFIVKICNVKKLISPR